jgi:predicted XRE-type DNA-binding protein
MKNSGGERPIRTKGSVLDHLGLEPASALELKIKAQLHQAILKMIRQKKVQRRQLEQIWNVPQPRVSEFMRGKLSTLSFAKMLYYAEGLGLYAEIKLRKAA